MDRSMYLAPNGAGALGYRDDCTALTLKTILSGELALNWDAELGTGGHGVGVKAVVVIVDVGTQEHVGQSVGLAVMNVSEEPVEQAGQAGSAHVKVEVDVGNDTHVQPGHPVVGGIGQVVGLKVEVVVELVMVPDGAGVNAVSTAVSAWRDY
ncbi:hypothetical protein CPB83DRAFT_840813 [Crepidotus variabilis]|uniref:Uncharacterized protein n=1 Tax=Crepidotus variabilis TaxID=179855 RepID=A0A9P6JI51_9AGAR|nr:hypothetical protein CPB83DRAFT_840813 [Crepidotus variabilis]